jgi:hypothetical protein
MSNKSPYSNYNKISLKTDSMVELIQELSKLGVFKGKPKPRAKKATTAESVRQTGDMPSPSFATDLRNLPPIQQIDPGMTAQQIEDIQQTNDASIATLRAEIQQGRIQDIQNVGQALFSIVNPATRFRSQPANNGVYDPFNQPQSGVELLPDVQDVPFDQTLNPGAPEAQTKRQQNLYPDEDAVFENIPIERPKLQPREPIGKKVVIPSLRAEIVSGLGLAPVPKQKGSSLVDLKQYYISLANVTERPINENIRSKEALFNEIYRIIDEEGSSV